MATPSGIDAQLGMVAEGTYGTYVAPTRFLAFNEESLALDIARMESEGLRSAQRVQRSDSWAPGAKQAGGSVTFDLGNKSFGLLMRMMFGAVATAADGAGFKHTFTIGDLTGDMFTMQVGRPDVAGTVQPFSYLGCKIANWALRQARDDFLKLEVGIDARNEDTAQALVTAIAPTMTEQFHWGQLAITVAGGAFEADEFGLEVDNALKTDRFKLRGNTLKDEPLESDKREMIGTLRGEFSGLTAYNRFVNATTAQIIATWTSALTYDTAKPFKIVLTLPTCRFDGATPAVDDADILYVDLPFKVLDSGSGQPITLEYFTSDTTP